MAWLLWICFFPWQERDQTNLGGGNLFLNSYHDNRNSLPPPPQGTCPQAPTCQLVGRVDRPPLSQGTLLISPTKVPTVPVGLMIMDTCPQGIGSKIGDFHKGQPTAGRQELPGHCHLGLNWNMPTRHKGCVCNHSIAPSQGFCFQLQGLCSGRGRRLKVPFIVHP